MSNIRKTTKEDLPLLSALADDLPEQFSSFELERLLDEGLFIEEGEGYGIALLEPFGSDILLLRGLVIDREHRYQKIGRQLAKSLHSYAKEKDFTSILVLLRRDEQRAEKVAYSFFIEEGYETLLETRWSLVMQKSLID